jgi:hypothetical protein
MKIENLQPGMFVAIGSKLDMSQDTVSKALILCVGKELKQTKEDVILIENPRSVIVLLSPYGEEFPEVIRDILNMDVYDAIISLRSSSRLIARTYLANQIPMSWPNWIIEKQKILPEIDLNSSKNELKRRVSEEIPHLLNELDKIGIQASSSSTTPPGSITLQLCDIKKWIGITKKLMHRYN